jgi:hypothetical protein
METMEETIFIPSNKDIIMIDIAFNNFHFYFTAKVEGGERSKTAASR